MGCPEIESFVQYWNQTHKPTARVIRAVPHEKFDWKPKADMMSLGELVHHFPKAELGLVRTALAGSYQKVGLDLAGKSSAEIADTFDAQHKALAEEVSQLNAEQLEEIVEFAGHKLRRIDLLKVAVTHEIHHRGQLYTYLHLVDVEPPKLYG